MGTLSPSGPEDRGDATAFAGRVARWDPAGPVRLVQDGPRVTMWADTPFEVLATRSVLARLRPAMVTVRAADLLTGLAVATDADVDLAAGGAPPWKARLPDRQSWVDVDEVPVGRIAEIVRSGTEAARLAADDPAASHATRGRPSGVPASLLDSAVLVVTGAGMEVTVRMRVLFALAGMGFAPEDAARTDAGAAPDAVRVRASRTWLRLDARYGAVVHRRLGPLPLLV